MKAWERWRGQIAKLDCSAFWVKCDHRQTREDLKNLLKVMLGNTNILSSVTCHWMEPYISNFLYGRPFTMGLAGTYSLAKKCMQLKPLSNPHSLMGLILGIQGENIEVVLAERSRAFGPWDAWQRLGDMDVEEAMCHYISIVTELYPSWADGSTSKNKDGDYEASSSAAKELVGPVFSTFLHEDSDDELKLQLIHASSREGEINNLLKCIDSGTSVNLKDRLAETKIRTSYARWDEIVAVYEVEKDAITKKDEGWESPGKKHSFRPKKKQMT
ncbi:hypothetical protein IFM89_025346, partial [Coptis chinensis]